MQVWDVETFRKVHELRAHEKWVYSVAYSPDGQWLASSGWDKTIKVHHAKTGEKAFTIFAHEGFIYSLAFSPDSRALVSASEDRSVRLWDIPSGQRRATFHGHGDFVHAAAFRRDGQEIATGGLDGSLHFWNLRESLPIVKNHNGWVDRLAVRQDSLRVLCRVGQHSRSSGPVSTGYNLFTGEPDPSLTDASFDPLPADFVTTPDYFLSGNSAKATTSPDGKLIARLGELAGQGTSSRSKDYSLSSVEIRDTRTGNIVHTLTGHSADVTAMAFSPDSRRLATASFDRTVKLWDMNTGQEVFTLLGHTAGVTSVIFTPDGNQIITGGIDFTSRVWNATPSSPEMTTAHDARYKLKVDTLTELKVAKDDLERGKILAKAGQWAMAAEAFTAAIIKDPDHSQIREFQANALKKAGNSKGFEAAIIAKRHWLEAKLAKNSEDLASAGELGQLLLEQLAGEERLQRHDLRLVGLTSQNGTILTAQDDNSIAASGPTPDKETYTIVARTEIPRIVAVRIEALADDSLPKAGPGRVEWGNFALSEFTITAAPISGSSKAMKLKLIKPKADFEQVNYPVSAALTEDPGTAWSIDPNVGMNHSAFFEVDPSCQSLFKGGTELTIKLDFQYGNKHSLGKFHLSVFPNHAALSMQDKLVVALNLKTPILKLVAAHALLGRHEEAARLLQKARDHEIGLDDRKSFLEFATHFDQVRTDYLKSRPNDSMARLALARGLMAQGKELLTNNKTAEASVSLKQARAIVMDLRAKNPPVDWITLKPSEIKLVAGATFTTRDDGSILVSGADVQGEIYTIRLNTSLDRISAIRLEALPDPSLPQQGPGRHPSGNFQLSAFRLLRPGKGDKPTLNPLAIREAWASFDYKAIDADIAGTLYEKRNQVWHVWGRFGEPHMAYYVLREPMLVDASQQAVIELGFRSGAEPINLGCFRLSATRSNDPAEIRILLTELDDNSLTELDQMLTWLKDQPVQSNGAKPSANDHPKNRPAKSE